LRQSRELARKLSPQQKILLVVRLLTPATIHAKWTLHTTSKAEHAVLSDSTCACRFRVPFKNFVVVSDPKLIPAILGRPGLPKTNMYKLTSTVRRCTVDLITPCADPLYACLACSRVSMRDADNMLES